MSTFGEIKTDVKRIFGDESGVQITDSDILRWANDALLEIVDKNEDLLEAIVTADLIANQQQYDPPANMFTIKTITVKRATDLSYFRLKGMSFQEFNEYVDGWDGTFYGPAPVPSIYMLYANKINIFPVPDTTILAGMKLYYTRTPVPLVTDADVPDVPEAYHTTIRDYILAQAYELDENMEVASLKTQQYSTDIASKRYREQWMTRESYPVINVLAEDYF